MSQASATIDKASVKSEPNPNVINGAQISRR